MNIAETVFRSLVPVFYRARIEPQTYEQEIILNWLDQELRLIECPFFMILADGETEKFIITSLMKTAIGLLWRAYE